MQIYFFTSELILLTEIRCPKLDMPANGGYKCSDGSYYNSRCEFFCSPGYSLKGQRTAVCQYNKVWSAAVPTCVGKTICDVCCFSAYSCNKVVQGLPQQDFTNFLQALFQYQNFFLMRFYDYFLEENRPLDMNIHLSQKLKQAGRVLIFYSLENFTVFISFTGVRAESECEMKGLRFDEHINESKMFANPFSCFFNACRDCTTVSTYLEHNRRYDITFSTSLSTRKLGTIFAFSI